MDATEEIRGPYANAEYTNKFALQPVAPAGYFYKFQAGCVQSWTKHQNDNLGIDPMVPHIIFISAMAANWQDYLEYLHSQLAVLVR
jgi:hypothetical protein